MQLKHQDTALLIGSGLAYLLISLALWVWLGSLGLVIALVVLLVGVFGLQLHLFRLREQQDAHLLRQVQALMSLYHLIPFKSFPPWFTGWAATPEMAARIYWLVREEKPQHVVELGSGATTVVIAAALEQNGGGRLTSIEQDEEYAARTRDELRRHQLAAQVEVVYAPLAAMSLNGETWRWYDQAAIPNERPIDLLVIDGPHRELQKMARYPSLPVFFDRLSKDATIVLDDAHRKDERRIVERWQNEYDELHVAFINTPKGTALIRRSRKSNTARSRETFR